MEYGLHKRIPLIYWMVIFADCIFLHFELPYTAITESLVVPLLLLYMMWKDIHISHPSGKFFFYIGLIAAFLGDVSQIVIDNPTFLLGSIIAFLVMNIAYSVCFYSLTKLRFTLPVMITVIILFLIAYGFIYFLGEEMGEFKNLIIGYLYVFGTMVTLAVNIAADPFYGQIAKHYLIPGVLAFLVLHIVIGLNIFYYHHNNDLYAIVMLIEGLAQYLIVKGMMRIYPHRHHSEISVNVSV